MSYYIEFKTIPLRLRQDTPADVIAVMLKMTTDPSDYERMTKPDHPFFEDERWHVIFRPYYGFKGPVTSFVKIKGNWVLTVSTEINYGRVTIEEFCNWITPYLAGHKRKEFVGKVIGENEGDRYNMYIHRDPLTNSPLNCSPATYTGKCKEPDSYADNSNRLFEKLKSNDQLIIFTVGKQKTNRRQIINDLLIKSHRRSLLKTKMHSRQKNIQCLVHKPFHNLAPMPIYF